MVEGEAVVQGGKPAGAKRPVVNCGDCLPWHPYGHYRMPEEERAALEDAGAELGCPDCLSGTLGRRLHSSDEALLMARAVEKDLRVRLKQLVDERAGGYRALAEREKAVGDLLWRARRVLRVAEGDRLRTELESVLDAAMQELGWGGAVLRPPERPHRSSAGRAG